MDNIEEFNQKNKNGNVSGINTASEQNENEVREQLMREQIEREQAREREKVRWLSAGDFTQKSEESDSFISAYGATFDELGSMNIFQLRDQMKYDEQDKSTKFEEMYIALDKFLTLSETQGIYKNEFGMDMVAEFGAYMREAKEKIHEYIVSRRRKIHIYKNGKRRLDIADRAETLLNDMTERIDREIKSLSEEQQRMVTYRLGNLSSDEINVREAVIKIKKQASEEIEMKKIIETGKFGEQVGKNEAVKACDEWIAGDYTEELLKLLKNPKGFQSYDEKNKFLAFITKKNHLLLANKMTISMACNSEDKVSMNIPWIKDALKEYVNNKISKEEMLTIKPQEIVKTVLKLIKEFRSENEDDLNQIAVRKQKILDVIPDSNRMNQKKLIESLCSYPQMKVMFESDEKTFETQLKEISEKVKSDEKLIRDVLKTR